MEISGLLRAYIQSVQLAPTADNSQPICYTVNNREHSILSGFDRDRCAGFFLGSDSHAYQISLGANLENGLRFCHHHNLANRYEVYDKDINNLSYKITFNNDTEAENDIPTEILGRHTNRWPYKLDAISEELLTVCSSFAEGDVSITILTQPDDRKQLAALIGLASEMRFQTPEIHNWLYETLRMTPTEVAGNDGLDIKTIALPPGGKLLLSFIKDWKRMSFLNHYFGMYKMMAKIEAQAILAAPAIAIVHGGHYRRDAFDGGRVMERLWLHANSNGLAVHPYYVLTDQLVRMSEQTLMEKLKPYESKLNQGIQKILDSDRFPHMVLRVGYPKREVIKSKRLSMDLVVKSA